MNPEQIREIRAMEKRATPGPWDVDGLSVFTENDACCGGYVCDASDPTPRAENAPLENMQLIAAMRNALPELLDAAEEADKWYSRYSKMVDNYWRLDRLHTPVWLEGARAELANDALSRQLQVLADENIQLGGEYEAVEESLQEEIEQLQQDLAAKDKEIERLQAEIGMRDGLLDVLNSWGRFPSLMVQLQVLADENAELLKGMQSVFITAGLEDAKEFMETETVKAMQGEIKRLRAVVHDLLLSADCTWEEKNEGHDWAEACEMARKTLKEGKQDG